jgi:hypothetical protein
MDRIVFDSEVVTKLLTVSPGAEICDASGQVIGRFYRRNDPSWYKDFEMDISEEELERREREEGGSTLDEIIADWEKLK